MIDQTKELEQVLWNSADIMRATMPAEDYKNYLLGLVFYKFLSDKLLIKASELLEEPTHDLNKAQALYVKNYNDDTLKQDLVDVLKDELSYILEPNLTYTSILQRIHGLQENSFQLEDLDAAFKEIERSDERLQGLFEDFDVYSTKLGNTPAKRNQMISSVIQELSAVNTIDYEGDPLGNAYEYLIGEFASDSGKKAGEFYSPQSVSKIMTQIVFDGRKDQSGLSIYDPTMGSGSLMLNARNYSNNPNTITYFGQELTTSTYNLARMNMILHGVPLENQFLNNGDTLDADWPDTEPTNFDAVVMNPPYSANWSADKGFLTDPRFGMYGVLAPKSKADFSFLLHGFYHLKDTGTMAIVLPHGVLFRGNAEGKIRQQLLEDGAIDTIIGLPGGIFYNTSIPTTIIILKKKGREKRDVLFIDASKEYRKAKAQNFIDDTHIEKIVEAYKSREDVDKFSYVASFDEIKENDFNLNIPRYVDTFEEEEPIDLGLLSDDIVTLEYSIAENKKELLASLDELVANNSDVQQQLDKTLSNLKSLWQ
ncbi:type I restriction enzyme M protein [Vagococcus fluvialis]|uniref:site-specific DNA-methyltransferase (adenine-specific) n=2 Tax=Vagococcus fluvialis TaxID=2738 RepID=A0A369AQ94_9ENTE|nr:type I restriction-modification system subunit M [Vagococcus fluvialis]RCX10406.1 type I restriction enzyme M protein [Vagococcus fluvialis]RST98663.1 type I restriction-modification system subunit M [Vagococcus fluvialis]